MNEQLTLKDFGITETPLISFKDVSVGDVVGFTTDLYHKAEAVITRVCSDGMLFGKVDSEKELPIPYSCIDYILDKRLQNDNSEWEYEDL